ncbi:hypothetical protein HRbin06_00915 [archaeon HR06]|nr:hypothetical protein HRbin06_00915 [archaeon HR06]
MWKAKIKGRNKVKEVRVGELNEERKDIDTSS